MQQSVLIGELDFFDRLFRIFSDPYIIAALDSEGDGPDGYDSGGEVTCYD